MQELLRHSSFRSTLDVYTQAVTPAKHAAQAAVISLVFSSDDHSCRKTEVGQDETDMQPVRGVGEMRSDSRPGVPGLQTFGLGCLLIRSVTC
jgi:hypothetical protein